MSHKQVLNSARRRVRKEQLARRHGQRCSYCRRPFADLREATMDHIVPHSLWRTWTVTALALACLDCNNAKADRFPLSLALVLLRSVDPSRPTVGPDLWPLLARLAYANQSAFTAMWSAAESADPIGKESTPDQRDDQRHTPVSRSIARPDCLRATRPVRVCGWPIGEAV
ncbi:HNH endonuclease [Streptomyces sp. NPDC001604]|uniref:HNH endonuclease n=1 Tax=Streptomyces sp. NPDC001604 TaxID=3364593 RepID=UPI003681B82C